MANKVIDVQTLESTHLLKLQSRSRERYPLTDFRSHNPEQCSLILTWNCDIQGVFDFGCIRFSRASLVAQLVKNLPAVQAV